LIPRTDPPDEPAPGAPASGEPGVGADVGATLAKLALRGRDGELRTLLRPAGDLDGLAGEIAAAAPRRLGITGGGAPGLLARLERGGRRVPEFDAWGAGARALLRAGGKEPPERFLVASVGTGTSIMLVDEGAVVRVGGTALGGGTVLGLGGVLTGVRGFGELAELARAGDRRRVDLLVSDIYRDAERPIPGDVNAASFAKLPRLLEESAAEPADLAHALMGMVGENVALIASALAARHGVQQIAFGGSTLRDNPALTDVLHGLCRVLGLRPSLLPHGEFTGAVGALELSGSV